MPDEYMGIDWSKMLPFDVRYALNNGGSLTKNELEQLIQTAYEPLALALKAMEGDIEKQDSVVLGYLATELCPSDIISMVPHGHEVKAGKLAQVSRYTPDVFLNTLRRVCNSIPNQCLVAHTTLALLPEHRENTTYVAYPSRIQTYPERVFMKYSPHTNEITSASREITCFLDDTKNTGAGWNKLRTHALASGIQEPQILYAFSKFN